MNITLGIDLGTNSIGWAIRNTSEKENQIIKKGVLTFDKGVGEEKGIEFPKVKKRTESRGKRRNYQAEKYRKWELLQLLIKNDLCPLTIEELNQWRKYTKGQSRQYPSSKAFIEWLRFDFNGDGKPDFHLFSKDNHESYYIFRTKAVCGNADSKKVFKDNPQILGRVFYQLVQRRGFKGRDEEEAKTMLEGSKKTGTPGRNEISTYLNKYKSLGAALYHYQKKTKQNRIRNRYNLRKDYENELKLICDAHGVDEDFYKKLWKSIIWQRPLRTQKGLIGICTYEKNKKRAPVSHPLYEEYRTWVFINNLKIKQPEGWKLENYLLQHIYPLFYKASNDFKLSTIINKLRKDGAKMESRFKDRPKTKVLSAKLLNSFQELLGENWQEEYNWNTINERPEQPIKKTKKKYSFEDVWHVLFTFDSQDKLEEFGKEKLNLSNDKVEKFSKIKLQQGYATLSLSAIKKVLPYLRKGIIYSKAVYLANIHKVLGTHDITDDSIEYFSSEIDKILVDTDNEKLLNNVVNAIIQDESIKFDSYAIEDDRALDESEKRLVNEKLNQVIGDKTWSRYTQDEKEFAITYVSEKFREFLKNRKTGFLQQPRLHDRIFNWLQETYQVPDENKKYLWHPSEQEKYSNAEYYHEIKAKGNTVYIKDSDLENFLYKNPNAEQEAISLKLLGSPEPLSKGFKNPMALKTLHKLRHLLNYLLQTNQIDEDTRIVVEIARELNDANKRKAIEKWQAERERENNNFKKTIEEINKECDTSYDTNDMSLIHKIRLWNEQNKICIYTGNSINVCDLFSGNKYDFEHTIPASMCFDNELKNLTIADAIYNRTVKKKQIPTQLPNYSETVDFKGVQYSAIEPRLQFIKDKLEHYENLFDDWLKKTKYASTKEYKDYCIQMRHYNRFNRDYWKKKLETFTITEYKAGWKNSQLRDTQTMTKYALPYLKTVFKKVEVQKGNVVNAFKEVYNIKLSSDKKDRTKHSHHAIDAAILTLIPKFSVRDSIIEKYNEEKDSHTGKTYHERPRNWENFKPSYILDFEKETLINNQLEFTALTPSVKKVRKRGRIQYATFIDENGKKHFKLDVYGNKIPLIAKGDTVRGQLHGESFYGAIKQPKRDEENKVLFDEKSKMLLEDTISLVIRKDLVFKKDANSNGFKTLEEIKNKIVDKSVGEIIEEQVKLEISAGGSLKSALDKGIWMLNKKGEKINRIRRIRCFESLKYETAAKVHEHAYKSDKDYKQTTLAQNGENVFCLFYKGIVNGKEERTIEIIGIFDLVKLKIRSEKDIYKIPLFNTSEVGRGKKKSTIQLYHILKSGQKVLFYKDGMEELKELNKMELSQRLYKAYQFESDGRIKLKHHLIAGSNTDIKKKYKEVSLFKFDGYQPLLRLRQKNWDFAIEHKDFEMELDGSINWKF
ncbi:type II CRISPR RNA-guided endonuclease Cas9 [Hyunsoonleella pacifica]|uniref:HNH Cas9-type domain-containing protein n=1 Tax=Hyunsoonleella pacifica TaxID=1080224 RepID=A0A4Q9FR44_9FLAO|nr:type II CRISPR RNA-guided endonuclease Cas9 [Hyunsoonleella pacifica]TBN17834.1 hypothetical protein EYD46_05845 [Hyunsoonleella pacifica]GGD08560.1 hypothetical protein GCM10011368_08110 [Hyunsoonleella pacifica]